MVRCTCGGCVTMSRLTSQSGSSLNILTDRHQFPNDQVLFIKPLFPALESVKLVCVEIGEGVEWTVKILRQHVLIETAMGQASTRIAASKVLIRPTRSVKVPARGDIKHLATDGKVDGLAVCAVVRE